MSIEVVMPQMGESIAEGTVVRWIKRIGEPVDRDEPLFEISTDKVDAEIPSPQAGVLLEIKVKEGETVPVNSVVAVIGPAGEQQASAPARAAAAGASSVSTPSESPDNLSRVHTTQAPAGSGAALAPEAHGVSAVERRRIKSSPVVRRIAKERGVDITALNGTGISGRVTKKDILSYLDRPGSISARTGPAPATRPGQAPRPPAFGPGEQVRVEKMSVMRRKIAEHMVLSAHTSPHVYSVYDVDFHRIDELRRRRKADYEAAGTRLTYTGFIAKATVETIREFPLANASLDGDNIVYKRDINLGIAVALDAGLIVPVIRNAGERDMRSLCGAIQDLAQRARTKQLKADEVQGGTFTITNPGVFGALYGLPLINQPQVAILGVGVVEKRVAVIDDMIAVRPRCYLSLGYDHRLIDGADGGRFLQSLKDRLEHFDEAWL
jgi:2-oxoglutarate dehydrogenase E2 component (dihydrolipoamide succinyltransferase)